MANPYEVEHNIKETPKRSSRRPDMSSFFRQLHEIDTSHSTHNNSHAQPTPADTEAAHNLLLQQFDFLSQDDPSNTILISMRESIESDIASGSGRDKGVPQSYLDELERVPKKMLRKGMNCPICAEEFLDDEYPLVVVLPCHKEHKFDLECVGPWLLMKGSCPLDRKELLKKKEVPKKVVEDDEEEFDDLYA